MVVSNKDKYNKKYKFTKNKSHSLNDISKTTGIKKSILQQVYNRGTGAWKNNQASVRNVKGVKGGAGKKMSKEQWSVARVYSFVMKQPGTWGKADKDLADKVRASKKR
tara:strand:- start:804 stop:1127 length:324 start_codon:yes stop_codon:yes gene_type:complete